MYQVIYLSMWLKLVVGLYFSTVPLSGFLHLLHTYYFEQNVVSSLDGKGGAIFILDDNCEGTTTGGVCSIAFALDFTYIFYHNEATAGSVLYGGLFDRCIPFQSDVHPFSIRCAE